MNLKNRNSLNNWIETHSSSNDDERVLKAIWEVSEDYSGNFKPDVEAGLARFQSRFDKVGSPKVITIRRRSLGFQIAAAVVAMLLAGVSYFALQDNEAIAKIETATSGDETGEINLADGSLASLNSESKLVYPELFSGNTRELVLSGEAFFEVKRNESKPFHVLTKNISVEVLGTSFNVRDKESESFSEVYVKTGKVAVSIPGTNKRYILEPGQLLSYNKDSGEVLLANEDAENPIAWKTKVLRFKNTPLSKIFSDMERLYKVEIEIENEALSKCPFTTTVRATKLEDAFAVLEASCDHLAFNLTSPGKFTVKGECCN